MKTSQFDLLAWIVKMELWLTALILISVVIWRDGDASRPSPFLDYCLIVAGAALVGRLVRLGYRQRTAVKSPSGK